MFSLVQLYCLWTSITEKNKDASFILYLYSLYSGMYFLCQVLLASKSFNMVYLETHQLHPLWWRGLENSANQLIFWNPTPNGQKACATAQPIKEHKEYIHICLIYELFLHLQIHTRFNSIVFFRPTSCWFSISHYI